MTCLPVLGKMSSPRMMCVMRIVMSSYVTARLYSAEPFARRMTKSSISSWGNTTSPRTRSVTRVSPGGTLKRTTEGRPEKAATSDADSERHRPL